MRKGRDRWYSNPRWLKVRAIALRRDGYMDAERKRYGIPVPAEVVHHIFPRDKYPEYEYELWNLISLSRRTHNEMHDRDTDELTAKGRELLRRTCRLRNIEIPEQYLEKKEKGRRKRQNGYQY